MEISRPPSVENSDNIIRLPFVQVLKLAPSVLGAAFLVASPRTGLRLSFFQYQQALAAPEATLGKERAKG